jgi:hypothetical protein
VGHGLAHPSSATAAIKIASICCALRKKTLFRWRKDISLPGTVSASMDGFGFESPREDTFVEMHCVFKVVAKGLRSSIAVGRYDIQYLVGEFVSAPAGTKLFVFESLAQARLPATRLSVPTLGGHGDRFGLARGQDHRREALRGYRRFLASAQ